MPTGVFSRCAIAHQLIPGLCEALFGLVNRQENSDRIVQVNL